MVVLTIMGLVTFSLFILEEAFQTVMFGTWAAQDAQDWKTVYEGVVLMEKIKTMLNGLNYTLGYIQPLAFLAYRSYGQSAEYYITALKSKVLAHEPALYVNQQITFNFTPSQTIRLADGKLLLQTRQIRVLTSQKSKKTYTVTGKLTQIPNKQHLFLLDQPQT